MRPVILSPLCVIWSKAMSRVMDEMLKFFDAVSGGSGPYGWIYAAEYERYGIDFAEHESHEALGFIFEYLTVKIYGKYTIISYERHKNIFYLSSAFTSYKVTSFESLPELFDYLFTCGN